MGVDVNSQEFKDAVKTAVETEVAGRLSTETDGLKTKNGELLEELKGYKAKFKDVDPEEYKTLKGAKRAQEDKDSDPEKMRQRIESEFSPKLTAAEERAGKAEGELASLRIDQGLTNALTEAKVAPELMAAAKALFKASRKVEVSSDGGAIVDGKPVADFVKSWAASDEAKPFIAAPNNNGGGSNGGGGGGAANKKAKDMSAKEKAAFMTQHGAEAYREKVDNER